MAEKIAVITTGGTIGSVISGTTVSVDATGSVVRDEIERICRKRNFDVTVDQALNKHSEDLLPSDWSVIASAINKKLSEGVRRIVVTHGTDTLAYSAAFCGLLFGNTPAKICFTGSYHALDAQDSDGPLNLIAAFRAVASDELGAGVYVAFRANERNTQASIIPALMLKPMSLDGLAFEGLYGVKTALYGPKTGFDVVNADSMSLPTCSDGIPSSIGLHEASRKVLQIQLYPGLDLSRIKRDGLSAIVLGMYHSGTGFSLESEESLIDFIRNCGDGTDVYLASFPSKYITKPYDSTVKLFKAGGIVIADLQPHVIFCCVTLCLAQGKSHEEIRKYLSGWNATL